MSNNKGVLSAKGERVNFDLLRIKDQIGVAQKTTEVKAREDFIDKKFNRRLKRQQSEIKSQLPTINTEPSDPEIEDIGKDEVIINESKNKEK
ncbi:MAG: hypothetical protein ACXW2E_00280 [Nitrososphaeraceae archaeon]